MIKRNILYLVLILAACNSANGQSTQKLALDPEVLTGKLHNGLTYYIQHNEEPQNRAELRLVINAGSILETDAQRGLAHFIEHMAFNGTKHFKKNQLINFLEHAGVRFGAHINAYTGFNETVYKLSLPTDSLDVFTKGFQILEDWAQYISFDREQVDKERGVIIEERRLRLGAQQRIQKQTLPVLFNGSRYPERLPIGQLDVLKNFDYEQLTAFYNTWYRPDLMAVIAVGDFDVNKVKQRIIEHFSTLKPSQSKTKRPVYKIPLHKKTLTAIVTDEDVRYMNLTIFYKRPHLTVDSPQSYLQQLKRNLYNRMMNNRLRKIILNPKAPFIQAQSSITTLLANVDAYKIAVVPKEDRLNEAFKAILKENIRVQKYGFIPAELERSKKALLNDYKNMYEERANINNAYFAGNYKANFLNGAAAPGIKFKYNFVTKHLGDITLDAMNAMAGQLISKQNRVVLLTAPESKKKQLPTEEKLLSIIKQSASITVGPYQEMATKQPLFQKKLTPGKVASTETFKSIGVIKLTLANGIKVFLKPTDFKDKQVLFSAYSPGGTSLYGNEDYLEGSNATSIMAKSGIAGFNNQSLSQMLSGKTISVSPYISELSEGFQGSASIDDLETLLQLVNLYFTNPRFDGNILQSWQQFQVAYLKNKYTSPQAVYRDTLSKIMNSHAERYAPLETKDIKEFDFKRMKQIYLERFANAGDFAFFFVGSFEIDDVQPIIVKYLSNLPVTNRQESWQDLGIHPPGKAVKKVVYENTEPKSLVNLIFTAETTYSPARNLQLNVLGQILQIRLRETLREKEGGVYSVGVRAGMVRIPSERYSIQITFGCAPENVDKLIASVYSVIDNIKNGASLTSDLQKVLAIKTQEREVALQNNSYWLSLLVDSYKAGKSPENVFNGYGEKIDTLTEKQLLETAKTYLNTQKAIQIILQPVAQ